MDFSRWLTSWLKRHPLKAPSDLGPAYTREVISKLPLQQAQPAPSRRWLWLFPNPAYALAAAAAITLIFTGLFQKPQTQTAHDAPRDAAVLAESPESDNAWIQETLQLLDQLEESVDEDADNPASEEEWLQELETLDQADLAASS